MYMYTLHTVSIKLPMKLGEWIIISVTKACRTYVYSVACMTFGAYRQVHRRLLNDDSFGAGEPLNETAYGQGLVVKGQIVLRYVLTASTAHCCNKVVLI